MIYHVITLNLLSKHQDTSPHFDHHNDRNQWQYIKRFSSHNLLYSTLSIYQQRLQNISVTTTEVQGQPSCFKLLQHPLSPCLPQQCALFAHLSLRLLHRFHFPFRIRGLTQYGCHLCRWRMARGFLIFIRYDFYWDVGIESGRVGRSNEAKGNLTGTMLHINHCILLPKDYFQTVVTTL